MAAVDTSPDLTSASRGARHARKEGFRDVMSPFLEKAFPAPEALEVSVEGSKSKMELTPFGCCHVRTLEGSKSKTKFKPFGCYHVRGIFWPHQDANLWARNSASSIWRSWGDG